MIGIVGAGAFGTALAVALSRNGQVRLWARDPGTARTIQEDRVSPRLPNITLPENVTVTADLASLSEAKLILLAIPTQTLRTFLDTQTDVPHTVPLVACCKGIELGTGQLPSDILSHYCPGSVLGILTGPSFAADIAMGLPTALTLACASDRSGAMLQEALTADTLRLYRTRDVTGAQLGGALKNVMAIACGAVMGAGLGESARAALMTRGFAEMVRLAETRGARPETLAGLSGFGDLVLTCTSGQSRNYQFGESLGRDAPFDPDITVEGAATARAMSEEARKTGIEMPVTQAVAAVVSGELKILQAVDMLLSRPLKEE